MLATIGRPAAMTALALGLAAVSARAQDPAPSPPRSTLDRDEPPAEFVPLQPRTAADRDKLDALRYFVAARALEGGGQRRFAESIELLEKAQGLDPASVPVLRALSRLSAALGRSDRAIEYSRKVIEADPADAETLHQLVRYYRRRNDGTTVESLLKGVLADPRLDPNGPARLVAEHDLGLLYADLDQFDKAAEPFERLMGVLDDPAANRLNEAELALVLQTSSPADAYRRFGEVFSSAKKFDLAARAFRRSLAYDPDSLPVPLLLVRSLLDAGKADEARAAIEPILADDPPGREAYDLLGEILTAQGREAEIEARLKAAADAHPNNQPLRYALADRYRKSGKIDQANAIYRDLQAIVADREGLAALSESLRKERKLPELLKLLETAFERPGGREAVTPQIEAISTDPAFADDLLDEGIRLLGADPPGLGAAGRFVLTYIATRAALPEKLIALERQSLQQNPSSQGYIQLYRALEQAGKHDEAAATLAELLDKFPDQKNGPILNALGFARIQAGDNPGALEAAREVLTLNPADLGGLQLVGAALGRLGESDKAIEHYKSMLDRFGQLPDAVKIARAGLSTVYVTAGDFEKGEAELQLLLELDPDDAGTNNDLGYLWADRGTNLEKAEALIRKAVEEDPENGSYLDSLGWVLFKRGQVAEALPHLEKAAQVQPTDATIFDHLGDVFYRLKEFAKARESWQKAAEIAAKAKPPDKRLPEIRAKLDALAKLEPPPGPAAP